MLSVTFGGRKRRLRKSSVIILMLIGTILVYKVYINYFYRHYGICYNDASLNYSKLYLTVSVVEGPFDLLMFQYASLLGLANLKSRRVSFPDNTALGKIFNLKYISSDNTHCWESKSESISMGYDDELTNLPQRNVSITGFLQSWKYFQSIEQTIRQEYRLKRYILQDTKNLFNKYVDNADEVTVIGVHVCRFNALSMNGIIQSNKVPLSYIQNAFKHMRAKFKSIKFLVVCDDINWCQAYLKDNDVTIAPETKSETQLALLSLCDHSIITMGTLGYWGAWLANGHTIYYKDYIREQSALATHIRYEDFFPAQWISLEG